ncbi:MAG: hypothetical protein WD342_19465 [Verrucomicrobiales bacterium]
MQPFFDTYEIRWFSRQPLPVDPALAFQGEPETRIDHYLFPSHGRCGVKYREGHLETKLQVGPDSDFETALFRGKAASWTKWTTPREDDGPPVFASNRNAEGWLAVKKRRWIHCFGWREPGRVGPVGFAEGSRVALEIGELSGDAGSWWTICLESSAEGEQERKELLGAAAHYVEQDNWLREPLSRKDSRSYSALLAELKRP